MTDAATSDLYGALTEPATLTVRRLLPASIDRVWAYLTDDALRRKWLAAGKMEMRVGAPFEFVWRNDELTSPPSARPEGFSEEHRMQGRITELDPPRKLSFEWPGAGHVTFALEGKDKSTLLTIVHSRLPDRRTTLGVSAGWHAHLDLLAVRLADGEAKPFWDEMVRLRKDYERRLPG
jgi:uncharacterized protein YndB with AHSA1/START domain